MGGTACVGMLGPAPLDPTVDPLKFTRRSPSASTGARPWCCAGAASVFTGPVACAALAGTSGVVADWASATTGAPAAALRTDNIAKCFVFIQASQQSSDSRYDACSCPDTSSADWTSAIADPNDLHCCVSFLVKRMPYLLGWLLGVPVIVLVILYLVFH